jgi:hypothetical protein
MRLKRGSLRVLYLVVDFGDRFAYKAAMPKWANAVKENKMAKKAKKTSKPLKKAKKLEATKPLTRFGVENPYAPKHTQV